jgi:hypothetical protein
MCDLYPKECTAVLLVLVLPQDRYGKCRTCGNVAYLAADGQRECDGCLYYSAMVYRDN